MQGRAGGEKETRAHTYTSSGSSEVRTGEKVESSAK